MDIEGCRADRRLAAFEMTAYRKILPISWTEETFQSACKWIQSKISGQRYGGRSWSTLDTLLEHKTSQHQYFMVVLEGWEDVEDLEEAEWTTSKTGQDYQQRSVSRERVKDSSGVNWWGRRPWSPTFSNNDVGLKRKKKTAMKVVVSAQPEASRALVTVTQ